jgi:hypothetical protein
VFYGERKDIINDQGQPPQWPQFQSGNAAPQQPPYGPPQWEQQPPPPPQFTPQTQYGAPPVPYYVPPPPPQWPPQQPQWNPQPQFAQTQQTKKQAFNKKVVGITATAIILTVLLIGGIVAGASTKDNTYTNTSTPNNAPTSSNASSDTSTLTQVDTSTPTPIPTPTQATPSKIGETITVNGVACTFVSVMPLQAHEFNTPQAGNEYIVVRVKLVNNSGAEFDYNPLDFHVKSGSGNIKDTDFSNPQSYTANNILNYGTLAVGGSVEGDIIFQVPIGDHKAELTWQPNILGNEGDYLWSLGL